MWYRGFLPEAKVGQTITYKTAPALSADTRCACGHPLTDTRWLTPASVLLQHLLCLLTPVDTRWLTPASVPLQHLLCLLTPVDTRWLTPAYVLVALQHLLCLLTPVDTRWLTPASVPLQHLLCLLTPVDTRWLTPASVLLQHLLCLLLQALASVAVTPAFHAALTSADLPDTLVQLLLPSDEWYYTNHSTKYAPYVRYHAARILVYMGLFQRLGGRVDLFDMKRT